MDRLEVVVVLADSALTERSARISSLRDSIAALAPALRLSPIVSSASREAALTKSRSTQYSVALERFLVGEASREAATAVLAELLAEPGVETVYTKPLAENPIAPPLGLETEAGSRGDRIPNFRNLQGYLENSPAGIAVERAWQHPGGRGDDVRVVDIEGGWQFSHIDLLSNNGGLAGGTPYDSVRWRDHGTAVLAQIGGDENDFGVTGIAPNATLSAVSHGGQGSAKAIHQASEKLRHGDVLLLEMHRPGPRHGFQPRDDQLGYVCVEWWPDDLLAIQHAVARGIVVVEAAGNGAEDLDHALYDTAGPGFPAIWRNPLRGEPNSGAVVVGAGAPPGGIYGQDRSRLGFSNFGSRVDCQGWGRGVVTAGYADLFRLTETPDSEDYWYTRFFSGTSSASPIVTGVVACLQGIARKRGATLPPASISAALRATGAPQQGNTAERIGRRPDLHALIGELFGES